MSRVPLNGLPRTSGESKVFDPRVDSNRLCFKTIRLSLGVLDMSGIFSRNEPKPLFHSPCIINLDDFGNLGTHWVCCWRSKNGTNKYFDSFGLPPPSEWEMSVHGNKHFFRNDNQIQWEQSVRCGYYCLLFLNERKKGTTFANILFTDDVLQNERIVKNYFS